VSPESSLVFFTQAAGGDPPWEVIIPIGIGVMFLLWGMGIYNALIRRRNHVTESWADIETELKRRHDLIPNLVDTVKGYAAHERETLESVVKARNAAATRHESLDAQAKDENLLTGALRKLFALAEGYPDLKASENFVELQRELANTENRIQRSRRFYNANVRDLNNRIEMFPSNVVAGIFGFEKREFFEIEDESERRTPDVKF
jgi:LemA protein